MRFLCAVLVSPEGDLGWAISGEEAGGDGEIGEPSYLAPLIIFWGLWRKLHFVHFSAVLAEVNESISVFGGVNLGLTWIWLEI